MSSHEKFVKFYHAYKNEIPNIFLEKIFDLEGNINDYVIPDSRCLRDEESYLIGSTVLHFVLMCRKDINIFYILLKRGVNFTLKNADESTVLHLSIENEFEKYKEIRSSIHFGLHFDAERFINLILKAHIETENFQNPCNKDGISHFHIACITNNYKAVEFFLRNGVPVAHAINKNSKDFAGYTPLHLAIECFAFETAEILLKYGACINGYKNTMGATPFDLLIMQRIKIINSDNTAKSIAYETKDSFNKRLIRLFLKKNRKYIANNIGLSNFHVSCIMGDFSKVEFALDYIDNIDHSVNRNSAIWPGYTALHFAALCNLDIMKLLLREGANIGLKNKEGKTPFDLCCERLHVGVVYDILAQSIWKDTVLSDGKTSIRFILSAMQSIDTLTKFLARDARNVYLFIPFTSTIWTGCTIMHLVVMFLGKIKSGSADPNRDEQLEEVLRTMLYRGANVGHQDARGQTPIHLAFRLGHVRAVNLMLQFHSDSTNPVDEDNLSHLHIACAAQNKTVVEKLLSNLIDVNSPVMSTFKWYNTYNEDDLERSMYFITAGSTALHICVANNNCEIAKLLLRHGGDVCAKDCNGLTPIHRVITLHGRSDAVGQILLYSPTLVECIEEKSKLSHLHIASFVGHAQAVRVLLAREVDINIRISHGENDNVFEALDNLYGNPLHEPLSCLALYHGFTPIRLAVMKRNREVTVLLLQQGANVILPDPDGLEPFNQRTLVFVEVPLLKVANLTMRFVGALFRFSNDMQGCLKKAIMSAKGYHDTVIATDFLYNILRVNERVHERFKNNTGLTLFHYACCKLDVDFVKSLLDQGVDVVDARAKGNSIIWPGYTSLHVLMTTEVASKAAAEGSIDDILLILLDNGADVTLSNAQGDTPLHMIGSQLLFAGDRDEKVKLRLSLMLKSQKNFKVNPVNRWGVSHFHMACFIHETAIIEEFLKNEVDVNQPLDEFVGRAMRYSPLHLALASETFDISTINMFLKHNADIDTDGDFADGTTSYAFTPLTESHKSNILKTVDILLEYGADLNARDVFDNTPLHLACHYRIRDDRNLFKELLCRFLERGADTNIHNVYGMTPLLQLAEWSDMTIEDINLLLNYGFKFNQFNTITDEGCIATIFYQYFRRSIEENRSPINFETIISPLNVNEVDDRNRTIIHNIIPLHTSFEIDIHIYDHLKKLIVGFVKEGVDIDGQDRSGMTALHLASKFQKRTALIALLNSGADINVLDANGQSAYEIIIQLHADCSPRWRICGHMENYRICMDYVRDLITSRLHVCENIRQTHARALERYDDEYRSYDDHIRQTSNNDLESEIVKTKSTKIGDDSLTLYDFMSETGAVAQYPHMLPPQRQAISEFFESIDSKQFRRIEGLLRLQYGKALARPQLVDAAKVSMEVIAKFTFPDIFFRYLENEDLKNIVAASI